MVVDIVINILLAFIGVVFALWYENHGSPNLEISPKDTNDEVKDNGWRTKFLQLSVKNNPRKLLFVPRQTAFATHGTVTFISEDGNVLIDSMPFKWNATPEPIKQEIQNNKIVTLPDFSLFRTTRYIDIPPDESETLALAIQILGDSDAYGWTANSYIHGWQAPNYRIPPGRYKAKIKIFSGDTKVEEDFTFKVGAEFEDFELDANIGSQ